MNLYMGYAIDTKIESDGIEMTISQFICKAINKGRAYEKICNADGDAKEIIKSPHSKVQLSRIPDIT